MEHESNSTKKRNNLKIKVLMVVFILSVGLMIAFAIGLVLEMREIGQGQAFYAALSVDFMPRSVSHVQNQSEASTVAIDDTQLPIEEAFVSFIDFDEMREQFPRIVGWIQSEGTVINYPIVQGTDNDFYLNHKPDGSRHRWGSIYLDYRNAADFSEHNIVIYGHDMASGDKFGSLLNYTNQAYFEQHYSMFIFTPTGNYVLRLFAGYVLNATVEVPPMFFVDRTDFESYISEIRSRSIFTSDVEVNYGDQLVFLATCTRGGSNDYRLVIVGRLDTI